MITNHDGIERFRMKKVYDNFFSLSLQQLPSCVVQSKQCYALSAIVGFFKKVVNYLTNRKYQSQSYYEHGDDSLSNIEISLIEYFIECVNHKIYQ